MRCLALTPTASNLSRTLRECAVDGQWVTAVDGQWLPGNSESASHMEFGDFLGQILSRAKVRTLPIADPALVQALVASACEEIEADSPLRQSAHFPGFHRRAVRVLSELTAAQLQPDALRKLSSSLPDYLARKLDSLALLLQSVQDRLTALGLETIEARIGKVLAQKSSPELPDLWIWVGSEYRPDIAALIRKVGSSAKSVIVVAESLPGRHQLTAGSARFAESLGLEPEFTGSVNALATNLFQETTPEKPDLRIQIASAADPLAEAEWAIRMALEELNEGKAPGTVAIYARQLTDYRPLLSTAAARLKLPISLAQQTTVAESGIGAYLLDLLKSLPLGYSPELLIAARSTYSGLSIADRALLRDCFELPEFEKERLKENAAGHWTAWVKELKQTLHTQNAVPIDQLLRSAIDLLQDERLLKPVQAQEATRERDKVILAAAEEALKRELQIRAVTGETGLFADAMTGEEFIALLGKIWAGTPVRVPSLGPGVRVTEDAASLGECQSLIILGMLEGIFPRRRSEDPILSDYERIQLNELLPTEQRIDDSHAKAKREREEFLRLCAIPTERIVFLYPQTDEERDNVPAFYLEEIRRIAGTRLTQTDFPRNLFTPPGEECIADADQRLQQALKGQRQMPLSPSLTTEEATEKVIAEPEEGYTLAELRDSIVCSFRFAFDRRLHVSTPDDDDGVRLGHLPHEAQLMLSETEADARDDLLRALDAEMQKLSRRITWDQIQLLTATGRRMIPEWIRREFRARQLWPKTPGSLQTSVTFGDPMLPDILPIRGQAVRIKGNVSGIARFGDYRVALRYGASKGLLVNKLEDLEPPYLLELGVLLLSLTAGGHPYVGAEIDGASGERVLFLCPRPADVNIPSDIGAGLRVIGIEGRKEFFEQVKELLARSLDTMKRGSVMPCAGDHCRTCAFGELCRSSQLYGEQMALEEDVEVASEQA